MRVIDLSLDVNNDMPGVDVSVAKRIGVEGWNATTLSLYSHCGTHMDAPRHFLPEGAPLDQQDLSVCVGMATLVNIASAEPKQLINVDDLGALVDVIEPGARLLFRTDWHKRYGTPEYRNELPRISLALAEWLIERKVAMIGVEPPSVADVNNIQELTDVHQTLFRGNVLIVEGLAHLDQIKDDLLEKGMQMRADKAAMHGELVAQLRSEEIDQDRLKAMVTEHRVKMEALIDLGIDRLAEFHKTLTAEQREKLVAKLESFKKWHGHDWE